MILKDDSFSSIVTAVRQGRIIFGNIRKFVVFLLSCNLSEILLIAVTSIFNMHFQLLPLQILFINIVTDVFPALALGVSPGDQDVMAHEPRDPESPILSKTHWKSIFIYSALISVFCVGSVYCSEFLVDRNEKLDPLLGNNVLFFTLIFSQLLHVFNMTNRKEPFMTSVVFRNRYVWYALCACIVISMLACFIGPVSKALDIHSLLWKDWTVIIAFSLLSLVSIQILKKLNLVL
jgi:P-type Ca2+ transporter type 2C